MKKNLFFRNNLFFKQADIINILGLTTLWIVMVFLVNPIGNFPLNDDWVFRFSTLILGALGVITTYGLLRQVKASQSISLLGALLIALNPIYFGLSNTFMTDVPFFAVATLSLYFLIRGFKYNSNFVRIQVAEQGIREGKII